MSSREFIGCLYYAVIATCAAILISPEKIPIERLPQWAEVLVFLVALTFGSAFTLHIQKQEEKR